MIAVAPDSLALPGAESPVSAGPDRLHQLRALRPGLP
jgi:hypothetical protein